MSSHRLLLAAATLALVGAAGAPAAAQPASSAKTEAAAQAATGKASTDAPSASRVQGTAKAVQSAAPSAAAAAKPAATQAPEAAAGAPAAKPVAVQGDLLDTLKLSGQFNTFVKAIDSTNLSSLIKTNKNLTVFAPTDAAFAAMPQDQLQKLMADKPSLQKFVLHHVVNAPIDSAKIKGARGPVPSGAGDQVLLDGSDEAGKLRVDGATIVQADLKTGSGLLHVVDHVLVAGQGDAAGATATAATGQPSTSAATEPAQPSAAKPGTNTPPKQ